MSQGCNDAGPARFATRDSLFFLDFGGASRFGAAVLLPNELLCVLGGPAQLPRVVKHPGELNISSLELSLWGGPGVTDWEELLPLGQHYAGSGQGLPPWPSGEAPEKWAALGQEWWLGSATTQTSLGTTDRPRPGCEGSPWNGDGDGPGPGPGPVVPRAGKGWVVERLAYSDCRDVLICFETLPWIKNPQISSNMH